MRLLFLSIVIFGLLTSCGGSSGTPNLIGLASANSGCDGSCPAQHLTKADVRTILTQAISAARILEVAATIAIVDRVGNVLAVYQMDGAALTTTINGQIGAIGGLEGVAVPSTLAAISKAGTGAYLSSQGNAFSTRTASQIIQEHFNPGEMFQPGGPLFGVQFSQLICSDVNTLNPTLTGGLPTGNKPLTAGLVGPRSLPLGLSADPGGIPLYKNGDVVGGIGIELDGLYRLDRDIQDVDWDLEEVIALSAGRGGFELPSERVGNEIFVLGKSLRTVDLAYDELPALSEEVPELNPTEIISVGLFFSGEIQAGAIYGTPASGIARTTRAGINATTLVDDSGSPRFPVRGGTTLAGNVELRQFEVEAVLDSTLTTAFRTRAAIRRPLDSQAHVTIWVVDSQGVPLGVVRTEDGPVFGIDVALQKARTAVFFSSADAGNILNQLRAANRVGDFDDYVGRVRAVLGAQTLTGTHAFSDRAGGNLSRPFFLDGIDGNPPGPFSLPFPGTDAGRSWSPFNTGLQLDLIFERLVQPLGVPVSPPPAIPDSCVNSAVSGQRLRNGIQIFPGSVPLYRGNTLIGGIGISGDGIDQDDLIAFFGASRPGLDFVGHTAIGDPVWGFNAPAEIRADQIQLPEQGGVFLRYVNCPEGPFRGDNQQRVCADL